jgi:hypothetical protein
MKRFLANRYYYLALKEVIFKDKLALIPRRIVFIVLFIPSSGSF